MRFYLQITVHNIPPSNNQFMGNSRSFVPYHRQKTEWHWLIKSAIKKKPKEPIRSAVVTITYFFPDRRRRDPDNYSGKFILDPLVQEGILIDDSFSVVELVLRAEVDKNNPRTEIEVYERE